MKKICYFTLVCLFTLMSITTVAFAAANPINPAALPPTSMSSDSPPAEYLQAIKFLNENRFNENDVKGFAYQFFSLLDHQAELNQVIVLFSDTDLLLQVPEGRMSTFQELREWYTKVRTKYQSNIYTIEKISFSTPSRGSYRLNLTVRLQAVGQDGKFITQRMYHKWALVDGGGYWPRITEYIVEPAQ